MWKRLETSTLAHVTLLAAGLLAGAGCAGTTDGETDSSTTASRPLMSATTTTDDGETAGLRFGYTSVDGWTLDRSGLATRLQAQNGNPGNGNPGNGNNGGGGDDQTRSVNARFSGTSPATVRFYGGAGQTSRFNGGSPANSRFSGQSSAQSRFDGKTNVSGGTCNPASLCALAENICAVYGDPEKVGYVEGCDRFAINECYSRVQRVESLDEETFSGAFLCFFSTIAHCANQGIEAAGSVSTPEQLGRAMQRGLENCSVDETEFSFEFSSGDSSN